MIKGDQKCSDNVQKFRSDNLLKSDSLVILMRVPLGHFTTTGRLAEHHWTTYLLAGFHYVNFLRLYTRSWAWGRTSGFQTTILTINATSCRFRGSIWFLLWLYSSWIFSRWEWWKVSEYFWRISPSSCIPIMRSWASS